MQISKSYVIFGAICAIVFGLSNAGLHPINGSTGYTGSPVDSNCATCHTGNNTNLDGEISIDGLPSSIETGETYTLEVTITNPNGNAARAGFQLVALNGTNGNAGTMSGPSASSQIRVAGGRNYFGHAPAPNFPTSNQLSFTVNWTAPATTGSNPVIKFYAATVIANGNGANNLDRVRLTNLILPITSGATPLDVTLTNISPTQCADSSDGSATASVTGGTPPYFYSWNSGGSSATNNNLPAGLAIVTVTDNTGVSSTASTNISSPPPISAVASGSVICDGASNGTASVLANGGVGGFTYSWSTGQGGSNISGLTVGTYTVTVTDGNGCQQTSETNVTQSPEILIFGNVTDISCFGLSNGSITTSIFGGTPGFSYAWSNGNNQANITNLQAGTYTITVTDVANCTASESFVVTQPASAISATFSSVTNATCFGATNGSAQITTTGGTPPYNYAWSNGASGSGNSNTQSNLAAGLYFITITDILDCTLITEVEISQPLEITISPELISPTCNGYNNGTIFAIASFVVGNVTYQWSTGGTTDHITNLSPGIYSITITDGNGCSVSEEFDLLEPDLLEATPNLVTNATCAELNDGTINISVSGGNGFNTYLWSNGNITQNLSSAFAGTYTITVTDWKGCSTTTSAIITSPLPMIINVVDSTNATCLGAANGSLTVGVTNGKTPYNYLWSNGQSSAQLTNVAAGNYSLTLTDADGCTAVRSFSVGTNASFSISLLNSTNVACFGDSTGTASVIDDPNYTYLWSTGQTTSSVSHLPAGDHTVIATESGCQSLPLTVSITSPPLIIANLVSADTILCPGDTLGFLSVGLIGGVGALQYQWSHGDTLLLTDTLKAGIYTISVTDENSCNVEYSFEIFKSDTIKIIEADIQSVRCNGQNNGGIALSLAGGFGDLTITWSDPNLNGDTLINLAAGLYLATITDVGGCTLSSDFNVVQPDILTANTTVMDESSAGLKDGAIILVPLGGTAPFTVVWSNGATTLNLENLSPGIYSYVLTDKNGCNYSSWAVIGGGDCGLSASYTTNPATCFNTPDGAINITINGSFAEYDVKIFSNNVEIFSPLNALTAGEYTIIISDSLSCIAILSDIQLTSQFSAIVLENLTINKPSTETTKDGSITAIISGGEGNITLEWSKNGVVVGTSSTLTNVDSGIYQLKITDAAGCILTIKDISVGAISSLNDVISNATRILPNPIANNFVIESDFTITHIALTDNTGKTIFNQSLSTTKVSFDTENVNIYNAGVYVCKLLVNDQIVVKKIVVLK